MTSTNRNPLDRDAWAADRTQGAIEGANLLAGSVAPGRRVFFDGSNGCTLDDLVGEARPSAGRKAGRSETVLDGCAFDSGPDSERSGVVAGEGGRAHTPIPPSPTAFPEGLGVPQLGEWQGAEGSPLLPCLYRNISTEGGPESGLKGPPLLALSASQKKGASLIAWWVQGMAAAYGLESLGFLTLTFRDHVLCRREAQRRFNSLASHVLRVRYRSFIWVVERQTSGRIHFHLVVVAPEGQDWRTGFDFSGVEARDYTSASAGLRAEWAFWRKSAKLYGFGRTELLPVKSSAEGIARYVGKYLSKNVSARPEADKGSRLYGGTRTDRPGSTRFQWVTDGSAEWRAKVWQFVLTMRAAYPDRNWRDLSDLSRNLGKRWAYHYRDTIAAQPPADLTVPF